MDKKTCTVCNIEKYINNFYKKYSECNGCKFAIPISPENGPSLRYIPTFSNPKKKDLFSMLLYFLIYIYKQNH